MKLSDTQSILLSHAARQGNGSLYPLPDTLTSRAGATKSIAALVTRCLAEERETSDTAAVSRSDGDLRYGLFITAAGLAAIGVQDDAGAGALADEALPPAAPEVRVTKASTVLALLQREHGATLPELIEATGWLPHTTRAALTGLRRKGHAVTRGKRDEVTCYHLPVVA